MGAVPDLDTGSFGVLRKRETDGAERRSKFFVRESGNEYFPVDESQIRECIEAWISSGHEQWIESAFLAFGRIPERDLRMFHVIQRQGFDLARCIGADNHRHCTCALTTRHRQVHLF